MPKHSFSICWLHLIWCTKDRLGFFSDAEKAIACSDILKCICSEEGIYLKELYVNPEHIHLLIKLPVDKAIKDALKLLKGLSSYRINNEDLFKVKFQWARGYAAISVSPYEVNKVANYVRTQRDHHKRISFTEEWIEYENIFTNHK